MEIDKERSQCVQEEKLLLLSPTQKEVYLLRKDGMTVSEIAQKRNVSRQCVYNLLSSAKKIMDGTLPPAKQSLAVSKNKNERNSCNGVEWLSKRKKYRATIFFNEKPYHIGFFEKFEEAVVAKQEAENQLYDIFLDWYTRTYPQEWDKLQEDKFSLLTKSQKEAYLLYKEGMTLKEIAQKLNISSNAATNRLFRAKATMGDTPNEKVKLTDRQEEIYSMYKNGMSGIKIAKELNITPEAVYAILKIAKNKIGSTEPSNYKNIHKCGEYYRVFLALDGKPVYIKSADNLEDAIKIRDYVRQKKENGDFGKWLDEFVKNGRILDDLDLSTPANEATGIKGVCPHPDGTYRSYISYKRKQYTLGYFDTVEEAAAIRKEAEKHINSDFLEWYEENRFIRRKSDKN